MRIIPNSCDVVTATRTLLLLCAVCLSSACSDSIESRFTLAPQSKLPAWFAAPSGMRREELSVELDFYTQGHATARLMDRQGHVISTLFGPATAPLTDSGSPWGVQQAKYPSYEVVTLNGIAQVIEHRQAEPIFYLNDDPVIANRLISGTTNSVTRR